MKRPLGLRNNVTKRTKSEMVVELKDFVDEIQELESLYDAALHQLTQESLEDALSLFRGVVHECDKLLRQMHDPQDQESKKVVLTPAFYLVYGNALYRCGLLDCDLHEHMEAAIEQYQLGLDKWASSPSSDLEKLHHAMAFILLHKASDCTQELEKSQELATSALEHIQKSGQSPTVLLESALALQKYADIRSDLAGRKEWNESAAQRFKSIENGMLFIYLLIQKRLARTRRLFGGAGKHLSFSSQLLCRRSGR